MGGFFNANPGWNSSKTCPNSLGGFLIPCVPSGGFAKKMAAKAKKPPAKKLTSPSDLFDNMLSGDKNVKPAAKPPSKEKVTKPKASTVVFRIRAPVSFWQDPDPGSYFRELRNNFLCKKLKFYAYSDPDPGSGNLFTRDPSWKNSVPG